MFTRKNVCCYGNVADAADLDALIRQAKRCHRFAESQSWRIQHDIFWAGAPEICADDRCFLWMLEAAQRRQVDIVLADTVACLGRHYFDVADLIDAFEANGVEVWTVAEGCRTDDIAAYFDDAQ